MLAFAVDAEKTTDNCLYLVHNFEEKPLVREYIANTMIGIEFLWGGPVKLETSEPVATSPDKQNDSSVALPSRQSGEQEAAEFAWQRVLYTMEDRKLAREPM